MILGLRLTFISLYPDERVKITRFVIIFCWKSTEYLNVFCRNIVWSSNCIFHFIRSVTEVTHLSATSSCCLFQLVSWRGFAASSYPHIDCTTQGCLVLLRPPSTPWEGPVGPSTPSTSAAMEETLRSYFLGESFILTLIFWLIFFSKKRFFLSLYLCLCVRRV